MMSCQYDCQINGKSKLTKDQEYVMSIQNKWSNSFLNSKDLIVESSPQDSMLRTVLPVPNERIKVLISPSVVSTRWKRYLTGVNGHLKLIDLDPLSANTMWTLEKVIDQDIIRVDQTLVYISIRKKKNCICEILIQAWQTQRK